MRDRDKLRRVKRANEVQAETLDEYRNTIKFLELKLLRLETEIEQAKEIQKRQHEDTWDTAIKAGKAEAGGSGSNVNWIEFEEHWEKTFKSK